MKGLYYAILLVCISVLTFNCQKEVSYGGGPGGPGTGNNANPIKATLHGNIVDENGQPAAGVTIKVGSKTITTNVKGYFRINEAPLDEKATLVTAEKAGYFKAYRSFQATSGANYVKIKLLKKESAGTVNAASGGNVTLANGTKIALPANGVVKASGGSAYTGTVNVYATYIDPTADDIAQVVPGSFMADDKNNRRGALASFGMMAVELESSAGEKLQIATGSAATLSFAIPSSRQSAAPSSIPLWYIDEQTGIWKEEGTATKNGNVYTGDVKHFSFWNCDVYFPAITLSLTLKNSEGLPIANACVKLILASNPNNLIADAYGYTDSCGKVSGLVPSNLPMVLALQDPCDNVVYTQNVGPFTQNTNLGTITVSDPGLTSILKIRGKVKNCSNAIVTNGTAIITYNNTTYYTSTNSSGEFIASFVTCNGIAPVCEVTGVDPASQQQGSVSTFSVTMPVTNVGDVTACGTSTQQFINYTIDGTNYSINDATGTDSLLAYTNQTQTGTPPLSTSITGMKTAGSYYISLNFAHNAATGTYAVTSLSVNNSNDATLVQPFNVILTTYAATAGGFFEGSFSGQYRKTGTTIPTYNINGTFRLRRL